MRNGPDLLEPEPRRKPHEEETTRVFWKPPLPEIMEPRQLPKPRAVLPYLLAPHPWPKGEFRINPEA